MRYTSAARGDIALAIELYELNIEASECIFGVLHLAEICIRNSIHTALMNEIGSQQWFRVGVVLPRIGRPIAYTQPMREMIDKAIRGAGAAASSGKIIAEITFGFWTSPLTNKFQQSLWIPFLHKAFPNFKGLPRTVHRRIETIQRLRNRIAHHERVLTSLNQVYTGNFAQPYLGLPAVLECVRWASIPAADWVESGTRYNQVIQLLLDFSKRGIQLI